MSASNNQSAFLESLGKKTIIFFLVGLSAWTVTKIPFFLGFRAHGSSDYYDQLGIEGSVNLVHWIHSHGGYHGTKLKSPAANFFLLHCFFGTTVLILIAATLVRPTWRRKYGYATFSFAILLGIHTLPAAIRSDETWMRWVFSITCLYVILASLLGFRTLRLYDMDPKLCAHHLALEHYVVAFGSWGAGFAELFGIFKNIREKNASPDGNWPKTGDGPHPMAGQTIYDKLPESVGFTLFAILVIAFWVVWPLWSVKIRPAPKPQSLVGVLPRSSEIGASPFCGDGQDAGTQPLLQQDGATDNCTSDTQASKPGVRLSIRPEMCRFVAYVAFWIMCLFAKLVTFLVTGPRLSKGPAADDINMTCPPFEPFGQGFDIDTDSHLHRLFGFNNMCVNWDYTPSRELTAMVYPLFEYTLLIYITLDFCNAYLSYQRGLVRKRFWNLAKFCFPIQIVLCSWFRMIFVALAYENIQGHTAGFLGMQLVLILVAILNTCHSLDTNGITLSTSTRVAASLYFMGELIISAIKTYLTACVVFAASYPQWAKEVLVLNMTAGQLVDTVWMIFNAILPLFISYRRAKTQTPLVVCVDVAVLGKCIEDVRG